MAVGVATLTGNPAFSLADDDEDPYKDFITTESGLRYKIIKEGAEGAATPTPGQTVKTQYTGWLDGFDSPKKFDSSRDRGRPFSFRVGAGQVIRGWDEAFSSMKGTKNRFGEIREPGGYPYLTSSYPFPNVTCLLQSFLFYL